MHANNNIPKKHLNPTSTKK